MKISTIYDRTNLIDLTTHTVEHVILTGLVLVTLILLLMLGDVRTTLIAAATIPFAVLFAFSMMALTGHSANLISIGAIDFGILVDASIVVLESVFRNLSRRSAGSDAGPAIVQGVMDAARPVLYSTMIILVAIIPLFTMEGVPGKIFSPMSVTYGFALTGALLFALIFAPVLSDVFAKKQTEEPGGESNGEDGEKQTWLNRFFARRYAGAFDFAFRAPVLVWAVAAAALIGAALVFVFAIGGEFMPPLEEGNIWIRATLPQDISFDRSADLADQLRADLSGFPEVRQVVSQMGRPDDGTDVTTFNNVEFGVDLKPESEWPAELHGNKDKLIELMQQRFSKYPGIVFGFSQTIQDNVEEASGRVKGANSMKLFGDDLDELTKLADQIQTVMEGVRGVADAGVFKVNGQPSMVISVNRDKAARYGIAQPSGHQRGGTGGRRGGRSADHADGGGRPALRHHAALSGEDQSDAQGAVGTHPVGDAGRRTRATLAGGRHRHRIRERRLHDPITKAAAATSPSSSACAGATWRRRLWTCRTRSARRSQCRRAIPTRGRASSTRCARSSSGWR